MIKTKPLWINLLFSLIALFLHGYLTQKFFDLQNGTSSGQSLCNLSATWNCDAVSSSRFAKFGGYPIALWALVTHIIYVMAQFIVLMRQSAKDFWAQITVWMTLIIVAASVVMGLISLTQLKTFCLFCLMAYVLSIVNLILIQASGFDFKLALGNTKNLVMDKTTWGLIIAVPVGAFIFGSAWGGPMASSRAQAAADDNVAAWIAAAPVSLDLNAGLRMGASPDQAKITLVEFADFRCPHCKHAAPTVKAFTQGRTDVALVFKPYPLDGKCNMSPAFNGEGDGISCRLAFAVQCSEKLNQKGWDMYTHIFDHQEEYQQIRSVPETEDKLCQSGLVSDCAAFKTCLASDETRIAVQKMAEEGTQAGIRGTPAFFINGKPLSGGQFMMVLEKAEKVIRAQ